MNSSQGKKGIHILLVLTKRVRALAGPLVSAAVILRENCYIEGLNDSKKVNEKKRIEIYKQIREEALSVSIGIVSPKKSTD